jgi:transcriptional regulator with XRE-family HTH domain
VTIGERLGALRKEKKLSQRDIAKKTGQLRCNLWRLEIGRQVPTIETLEKMARALEIQTRQNFYDDEKPPKLPNLPKPKSAKDNESGYSSKRRTFARHVLSPVRPHERT